MDEEEDKWNELPLDRSWFSAEPESEDRMSHVSFRYTPCEILRQIYKKSDDPEIKHLARVASTMTKRMAARISKYEGKGWGQKVYPRNPYYRRNT